MTPDLLIALLGFAFVTSVTPGPNNLMLMASGANFGFWRTIPHMLGISLGFAFLAVMVGLGLAALLERFPALHLALKIASIVYLLYLAFKIARAAPARAAEKGGRPMTFLQAAGFQWVNPKAWSMALGAIAAYAPDQRPETIALVAFVFAAVNLPTVSLWCVLGREMRRFLGDPGRLRLFNWTMAGLLVLSLVPVLAN